MNYFLIFFSNIFLIVGILYIQHKFKIALDTNQVHKIPSSNEVPLSGGFYILFSILIGVQIFEIKIDTYFLLYLFPIFILGYFSDTLPKLSPKFRLFLQIVLIITLVALLKITIYKTEIFFIDKYLNIKIFNIFFTSLCIVILLNGSNFIDGVNGNLVGYALIVFFLMHTQSNSNFEYLYIILILFIFYIFNIFGKCFLGDNGVYVISIILSYFVIKFVNSNHNLSPIIAINLLWYPAFENLFSILRRMIIKDRIYTADRKHLHILLFSFINIKTKKKKLSNTLSGLILNIYNFLSLYASFAFIKNVQILILIVILNIIFYMIFYFKLLNTLHHSK